MHIQVLYPQQNFSAFSYHLDGKIDKRNYDEDGNFIDREYVDPHISQYEVVGEHYLSDELDPVENVTSWIIHKYNGGDMPSLITKQIKGGVLNVSHSSFSVGDIIRLNDDYYISNGITFDKLPESFTK